MRGRRGGLFRFWGRWEIEKFSKTARGLLEVRGRKHEGTFELHVTTVNKMSPTSPLSSFVYVYKKTPNSNNGLRIQSHH